MAHLEKKNKNVKKAASKPAKTSGQPVLAKYIRNESAIELPTLAAQAKKGRK